MNRATTVFLLFYFFHGSIVAFSQESKILSKNTPQTRPNILWLTFEDTSASELSLYGNPYLNTPTLESLAKQSLVFDNAFANAPQCSPARSTLISGVYATTYGTDYHRANIEPIGQRVYFPALLKQSGYFTSNNVKRDYNTRLTKNQLSKIWTEFAKGASYKSDKRKKGQPFFSVFNANMTHMSRLTSAHMLERRDFSRDGIPKTAHPGHYLPDLPAVRSDYQFHLEGVFDVDQWLKLFLDELERLGLRENTIVFVFSDHGGSSPRGKGFLFNTGLQVPLIIYAPEKFKHLLGEQSVGRSKRLVSFVDFGPTILSLAGIKPPVAMQGKAFLGQYATRAQQYVFTFRTNQENHFDPWRGVTDGRYNYFKTYLRRKPMQLRNGFQWLMPSNIALDQYALENPNSEFTQNFYKMKHGEYLFDLQSDPLETKNLALDTNYKQVVDKLRKASHDHLYDIQDLGFVPLVIKQSVPHHQWFNASFNFDDYLRLVEEVGSASASSEAIFEHALRSKSQLARFWGVQGMAELAAAGLLKKQNEALRSASNDQLPYISAIALEALVYLNEPESLKKLLAMDTRDYHVQSSLETIAYLHPRYFDPYIKFIEKRNTMVDKSILRNLGIAKQLITKKQHKKGIRVNSVRRPIIPRP